jgi:hypothetical protein
MVEIFAQPLVGALCLIVFHIQAVIDSPDHCAWQLGLQVVTSQNSSQQKSSPISSVRTFACHFYTIIVTSGWKSALFVTSGWNPALCFFDFRFCYSTSHSNSIVISPFVQAVCFTSRRKFFDPFGTHMPHLPSVT